MSQVFVSVVIPARNAAATLPDCLLALRAQTLPRGSFEVIVVDDGSRDATALVAAKFRVHVVSIRGSGPAAARNRGIAEARGDIIAFTDADCAPDPDWLEALVKPFEDPQVVATKGVYRTEQKSWTARFVQAEYESRYRRMAKLGSIDFVDTYSAAYRREALESCDGFDESFPVPSVEDQELSFRLSRGGARMLFCPDAVVSHRHASDPVTYFRKKMKIAYWKVRVLGRFPEKTLRDSHTPPALKAEILLACGMLASIPLACWTLEWRPLLASFLVFGCAVTPFATRVAVSDPALGVLAPFFLMLRAVALASGMVAGVSAGQLGRGERVSRLVLHRPERVGQEA